MIDKFLYTFFGYIDSWFEWVESYFVKPQKNKTVKTVDMIVIVEVIA